MIRLTCGAGVLMANLVFALPGVGQVPQDEGPPIQRDPRHERAVRDAAKALGTSAAAETVYVGFTPGYSADNYWSIWTSIGYADEAVWDFEPPYEDVHGDSLQGWWPLRFQVSATGGSTFPDASRPWFALDYGNVANYAGPFGPGLNGAKRTFGVTGVWHVDGGNTVAVSPTLDNLVGQVGGDPVSGRGGVTWAPLAGNASAWMGLRRQGDTSYLDDPSRGGTGNAFNEDVMVYNGLAGAVSLGGTDKRFPGYGDYMDQILYRDVDLTGPADTSLTVSFLYRTTLSTGVVTNNTTRTGWFQHDPLRVITGGSNPNFIESSGNPTPPADSFMVYVGAPAEGSVVLSDGVSHPIYDPQRRWFGEVIRSNEGLYRQILSRGGTTAGAQTHTVTLGSNVLAPLVAAGGGRVRLVFRIKTNQFFSDEGVNNFGSSSSGAGAAIVDQVAIAKGTGPLATIGGFENPVEIDNRTNITALAAWKSTGKAPQPYHHTHALDDLNYQDLCGAPGSDTRICSMAGVVISMGDHDKAESTGNGAIVAEQEPFDGIMSPTIQLCGPYDGPAGNNRMGIQLEHLPTSSGGDFYMQYDLHRGIFDVFTQGNYWQVLFQSYPAGNSATGAGEYKRWGMWRGGSRYFTEEKICATGADYARGYGMLRTTNASGIPDSVRFGFRRRQECYRFEIPSCVTNDLGAWDNLRLGLVREAPRPPLVDNDSFQDAFPFNQTPGIAGLPAAFDTTTALVRSGVNKAPFGNNRFIVPGDSLVVSTTGQPVDARVDLVFRILPGPGNYVDASLGAESQLRAVPTAPAAIPTPASGVVNFWSNYLFDNGTNGTPGGHPVAAGGALAGQKVWSPHVWNSARMDTAEHQLFQLHRLGEVQPRGPLVFMTAYHENELTHPHRRARAIPRNICFTTDTTASTLSTICGSGAKPPGVVYPPAWAFLPATGLAKAGTGDPLASPTQIQSCPGPSGAGLCQTIEGTKIIPDGLLTPGSHVQYFFRREDGGGPGFSTMPDTNIVLPQVGESSLDGHRWKQFSILPDRWKSADYLHPVLGTPGSGEACMLVVDWADRLGNERAWVETAEALGLTDASKRGAHNGWNSLAGSGPNDPAGFVRAHVGQAGTTWDLYGVFDAGPNNAGNVGNRLGYSDAGNPQINDKRSRQGPSPQMLAAYYKSILLLSGYKTSNILGPYENQSANDIGLLQGWLSSGSTTSPNRGLWAMGSGFNESAIGPVYAFVVNYLGADLLAPSYLKASGDNSLVIDLQPTAAISPNGDYHGLRNLCTVYHGQDVLYPYLPEAFEASYYTSSLTYAASVLKPHNATRPWIALSDGWDILDLGSPGTLSAAGRHAYVRNVLENVFGAVCPFDGSQLVDVSDGDRQARNFLALGGNPVRGREATVRFGLARPGRVEVRIYDVAGRLVKTVADRNFEAGEHTVVWDGTDAAGQRVASGVYFTKLRQGGGFEGVKKLVVLGR